jgi:hypothetical protein
MNKLSKIVEELQRASLFDLYRLRVTIEHMLDDPRRIEAIKRRLRPGQAVTYFDHTENRSIEAIIIKVKRTRLLVENKHNRERWDIPFYWVNLEEVETDIGVSSGQIGLDKSQVKIGDKVGFLNKQNEELYGEVIKLNRKTAGILVEGYQRWRVAYSLLFPVIDGEIGTAPKLVDGKVMNKTNQSD